MWVFWGVVVVVLGSICWAGQVLVCRSPAMGVRLGISEAEADVEPTFWADVRGEALWDSLSLWTLPAAGVLLILGIDEWAYFGLVGGGMYVYFAGRGIATRRVMQQRGFRIGATANVRVGYVFLVLWGLVALITIAAAASALADA